MANERDIAFAREILRTIFGLDKQTIDNVIREIRATADVSSIKTTMIRQRIGAHSLRLLRNGLNAAKEAAPADTDDGEEDDEQDQTGDFGDQDMRSSAEDEESKQQAQKGSGSQMNRPGAAAPVRAESVNEAMEFPMTVTVKFESPGAARTAHESMSSKTAQGVNPEKMPSKGSSFKVTVKNQTGYQRLSQIVRNYRGDMKKPGEKAQTNESTRSRRKKDNLKEFVVDVDPHDEEEPMRIRRMINMAQQSGGEERLMRQLVQDANNERDKLRKNGNAPVDNIDQQISRLKQQLALLQRRKASLERQEQEAKQQGPRQQRQDNERQ